MWSDSAFRYFRRAVLSARGSSCFTCYTLTWNEESGRAEPCRQNTWQFTNFRIYTGIMTFIVTPIFFARTFQILASTKQGEHTGLEIFLVTFVVTDVVFITIPYLWFLSKSEASRQLVACSELIIRLQ